MKLSERLDRLRIIGANLNSEDLRDLTGDARELEAEVAVAIDKSTEAQMALAAQVSLLTARVAEMESERERVRAILTADQAEVVFTGGKW